MQYFNLLAVPGGGVNTLVAGGVCLRGQVQVGEAARQEALLVDGEGVPGPGTRPRLRRRGLAPQLPQQPSGDRALVRRLVQPQARDPVEPRAGARGQDAGVVGLVLVVDADLVLEHHEVSLVQEPQQVRADPGVAAVDHHETCSLHQLLVLGEYDRVDEVLSGVLLVVHQRVSFNPNSNGLQVMDHFVSDGVLFKDWFFHV